ncbi:hypothetical protein SAMN02745116_01672 [Pilibacter termitis]|jgi:Cof subfamily protein (haloacid dehalogenase superfamily)|uniref:Haloacid dehalogenase-like hydrolase n=1 Tax=Pilibacter termitis TaxID=263852 RepID=A0A1T4P6L5_9ENTE|nr:HAD family hydrolase [Pilibacter termitis]SJZ87230.1 hypothetical protein SAMN02745116_01672 [Pilibacter termitis]
MKIIFLDVDGTLVNYQNQVPESAVKAIQLARKNGHKVYLNTGRSKAELPDFLLDIGVDGMILGNGSYVEESGEVLFEQVMSEEDSRKIVDYLHGRNLPFYLESNNGLFASEDFVEKAKPVMQKYMLGKGKTLEEVRDLDITQALHGLVLNGELYRKDLNKVSFILNDYQDYLEAKETFAHLKVGTWGGKGETALFGDIGVAKIDKKKAVKILLAHLNASEKDTFAFGDAKIDIPMLEIAQIGVAMGNGGKEIKQMADYITDDVDKDGLYKAFLHFNLLK